MSSVIDNVSIVVPSRYGMDPQTRLQLQQQTLTHVEFIEKIGISPAARARNVGAFEAVGDYIVFCDDDIGLAQTDVLARMIDILKTHPDCGVQVTWRLAKGVNRFQKAQVEEDFQLQVPSNVLGYAETPWHATGTACFAISKHLFMTLGGFDESLISAEDCDLAYRLVLRGGKIFTLSDVTVSHEPPKNWKEAINKVRWYEQGNAQLALKYPDSGYRIVFKNGFHIIGYLFMRTMALFPLMIMRASFHNKRPKLKWRPVPAILSKIGPWV